MNTRRRDMVLASFAADSLALGAHWIYDTDFLSERLGRVETLLAPDVNAYHQGKKAGDFTHYGDQTLLLLEHLAREKRFDAVEFGKSWREFFETYNGYRDHASKNTLNNMREGHPVDKAGSMSTDLAGAARIAPLVSLYADDEKTLVAAAEAQTRLTHTSSMVVESARFLARAASHLLRDEPMSDAFAAALDREPNERISGWLADAEDAQGSTPVQAVSLFGQSCNANGAMPAVLYLALAFARDINEGLVQNVMAGGDSAARGMILGMLLGASSEAGKINPEWVDNLNALDRINAALDALDA